LFSAASNSSSKSVYRIFPLRSSFKRASTYLIKAQALTYAGEKVESKVVTLKVK